MKKLMIIESCMIIAAVTVCSTLALPAYGDDSEHGFPIVRSTKHLTVRGDQNSLAAALYDSLLLLDTGLASLMDNVTCSTDNDGFSCTFFNGSIPVNSPWEWADVAATSGDESYGAILLRVLKEHPKAQTYIDPPAEGYLGSQGASLTIGNESLHCDRMPERHHWFREPGRTCRRDDHRGCYEQISAAFYKCSLRGNIVLTAVE